MAEPCARVPLDIGAFNCGPATLACPMAICHRAFCAHILVIVRISVRIVRISIRFQMSFHSFVIYCSEAQISGSPAVIYRVHMPGGARHLKHLCFSANRRSQSCGFPHLVVRVDDGHRVPTWDHSGVLTAAL